ncbi:hypothetical protein AMTRI_Chr13g89760 [Amborella trichopoda]
MGHALFLTTPPPLSLFNTSSISLPSPSSSSPFLCRISTPGMDRSSSTSLYPAHRCKTLYLVRHGQGFHNVAGEKDHKAYMSEEFFDASLTPLGWEQVDKLRKHVHASGIASSLDLVIRSRLLRTMQTAVGVFGGDRFVDGVNGPFLMVSGAGNTNYPAISSLSCPPFIAVEDCREHLGIHPCDKRRSINDYKPLFPAIDFSLIETNDDTLWKADTREEIKEVATRGKKFLDWLWTRPEKEIAVVTHSGYLVHTLDLFGNDCHPSIKEEITKPFANCELRSMVIVDKGMIGSNISTDDFPGKKPPGVDVPSDFAHVNQPDGPGEN